MSDMDDFCIAVRGAIQGARDVTMERVTHGMVMLDQQVPGWDEFIELELLEMGDDALCVVGQIQHAVEEGKLRLAHPEIFTSLRPYILTPGENMVLVPYLVNSTKLPHTWADVRGIMIEHGWWPDDDLIGATNLLNHCWTLVITRRREALDADQLWATAIFAADPSAAEA